MSDDDAARATRARIGSPCPNPNQAAWYLGISLRHLERLRSRWCGPPFRKHARCVCYHVHDLVCWSESSRDILR